MRRGPADNYHEEEALGKAYDARLMKRLFKYIRPYRTTVMTAVFLLLLNALSQIVQVFLVKKGIDDHIIPGVKEGFTQIVLLFLVVVVLTFIFRYGQFYLTQWLGQKVQHDIRMQVFRHLQQLHLGFYDKNPVGRLVTRVTNDVNVLNEMFSSGVVNMIGDIFMLVLIVGAMLYINWQLALITFLVLPFLVLITFLFRSRARNAYREVRTRLARLNSYLQEHILGIQIVQLFNREQKTFDEFDEINRDLRGAHFRSIYYYAMFFPAVEIVGTLSVALLLYYGGLRINADILTFGELIAFIQLVERFYRPIRDLSEQYNILQSSMASSERIFKLLDTVPAISDPSRPKANGDFMGKIEFDRLWFAYNAEDWVLKDISFTVEPGQKVAIVGATGAGKSSLISLLYRFYDYQKGVVRIDGREIKNMPLKELRGHLGLVLQDVFLFSGDYAGNVRLRNREITDDEVIRALSRVGFDRFLEKLPDGIRTEIRERGATLSTGQKQLLSFARALAFDPDILILDEATSSVDTETERLIQTALEELLKGRTSIVIAHRLSTIEKADKIIVLHHGRVREMGWHDELLKAKGIYYKLYEIQFKRELAQKNVISTKGI
ncbi:MAG: ABC transporter ATP-binding protein [Candidatus Zixiibacteriota bacterium]